MQVQITFDSREFDELIQAWQEPAVKKTLGKAASAWGIYARNILKIFTPVAKPGNEYASGPGNLRDLTRARRMNARYGIGVVVAAMGKNAYYRRWVVGGTKPHIILPKAPGSRGQAVRALALATGNVHAVHHPGAHPNDYVARAFPLAEAAGNIAAEGVIFDGIEARHVTSSGGTELL